MFCFISDWELAHEAGRKQNKENATAFLFLAKESLKGMGKQSEANSDLKADRKQNKENATAFLFLAKESLKGMGERSEANSSSSNSLEKPTPTEKTKKKNGGKKSG